MTVEVMQLTPYHHERYVVLLPESTMTELVLPLRSEAPLDQSVSRGTGVSDSQ